MNDFTALEATVARVKTAFADLNAKAAASDVQPKIDAVNAELDALAPPPAPVEPAPVV